MEVKLGGRYKYNYLTPWDLETMRFDKTHDGLSCRVLRRVMPKETLYYLAPNTPGEIDHLFYVVFDDGYITVVSSEGELCPLPTE